MIVWAWVLYTLYANRFDTDDLIFRLSKSGAMLAIAAIAVIVPRATAGHGGTIGFAISYVVLRALLIGLYGRAWRQVHGDARRLCEVYIAGYSLTTALWLASIFTPGPVRYVLWGVAMVVDLIIPTRAWRTLRGASVVTSHLVERFGTFFIIVLGESVAAAVAGVAGFEFTVASWFVGGLCFVVALSLWWIYFDLADTSVVGRGALGLIFVYAHFSLLGGVAAFGEGTKLAIMDAAGPSISAGARWAMAGGVAAFALSLAVIHLGGRVDLAARSDIPRPARAGHRVRGARRGRRWGGTARLRRARVRGGAGPAHLRGVDTPVRGADRLGTSETQRTAAVAHVSQDEPGWTEKGCEGRLEQERRDRLERLFEAHYAAVLADGLRRAPRGVAEDVASETFAIAFRRDRRRARRTAALVVRCRAAGAG